MGKSAKLHKRIKKSKSSTSTAPNPAASGSKTQVQTAKKHASLKEKSGKGKGSGNSEKGVLGGADYLALLTGSRKQIAEEAKKLPQD